MQDPVVFARDVDVIQIPDGTPLAVPAGARGWVMQVLGGNFTVRLETGHLVRLDGAHAEVIGQTPPASLAAPDPDAAPPSLEEAIWARLRTCYDPEIPVNIVDLGLIYALDLQPEGAGDIGPDGTPAVGADSTPPTGGTRARVTMTLTAPGCGMGQVLKDDVTAKVREVEGITEAEVELTFDPPWSPERMTEEARLELGFF
jgi:metal-sulfur cluster biosynthetic enzyme